MASQKGDFTQAVGQAMRALSKGQEIPKKNALLTAPLITQHLYGQQWEDIPERRQQAVKEVLQQIVNQYGTNQVPKRQQEAHELTFNYLYSQLRGQEKPSDYDSRERSYVRYRPKAYKMLADTFSQKQEQMTRAQIDDTEDDLKHAREQAHSILNYLQEHPYETDFFACDDLQAAAQLIQKNNYYREAEYYYDAILRRLLGAAHNKVVLTRRASVTQGIANCWMNQNNIDKAIAAFRQLVTLAQQLGDIELETHGLQMLGVNLNLRGDWQNALNIFDEAHARAPKNNNYQYRVAWIKRDKIPPLVVKGDFQPVNSLARESLKAREKLLDPEDVMMTLEVWGRALVMQGKYPEAEARLREARSIFPYAPSKLYQTMVLTATTALYVTWGQQDKALVVEKQARDLALQYGLWHQLSRLNQLREKVEL